MKAMLGWGWCLGGASILAKSEDGSAYEDGVYMLFTNGNDP